jgi:hypothetical protein
MQQMKVDNLSPSNQHDTSNNEMRGSSKVLASSVQSQGYYKSANFKPAALSGEKPIGWFDTKYSHWISNRDNDLTRKSLIDSKNAAPSR